jgi:hypothetical protein
MRPWPRRVNRFSTSPAERGCLRRYPRDRHQGQASRRLEGSRLGVRAGRPRRGDGDRRRLRRRNFGRNRGAVFRKRGSSTSPSRQVAVARRNLLPESHGRRSSSPSTVTPTSRLLGRSSRPSKTSSTHGSGPSPSRTVVALASRVSSIPPGGGAPLTWLVAKITVQAVWLGMGVRQPLLFPASSRRLRVVSLGTGEPMPSPAGCLPPLAMAPRGTSRTLSLGRSAANGAVKGRLRCHSL